MQEYSASGVTTTCTACGKPDGASQDPFYYDWKGKRYWIFRCSSCTHQFVYPTVTPADQAEIYGDQYFTAEGDWAVGVFEGGYREATKSLIQEAHEILDMLPTGEGKQLLDVGCAGGVFLSVARERRFEVQGIEINPSMANYARVTYGLTVTTGRIEDVPGFSKPIDVVTILDVLEHVPNPLHALRRVAGWMRPGGVLLIRGPLANSRMGRLKEAARRLVRVNKRLPGYPLDANMFNKRSLSAALAKAGFTSPRWINEGADFANLLTERAS